MTTFDCDAVVVGAGVVGLAIARRLALAGLETLVIEREGAIGMGTSSRNSEVIHAGLYYPPGSLKARLCREGRERLYAYCEARGVGARRVGKLVLAATADEVAKLEAIMATAKANGVNDLQRLTREEVAALEPALACHAAFLSPSTGIIDTHGLMLALQGDLEEAAGTVAFHAPVAEARPEDGGFTIVTGGADATEIRTRLLVNAAGHGAPRLAASIHGEPAAQAPRQWFAKGNYVSLIGRQPFSRLVYPLPDAAGLGIHATLDLAGRCRFGPDVEWVEHEDDLEVSPTRLPIFEAAIRRYWPALPSGALQPDYAGIRPKLHGPGSPMPDFRVDGPEMHGLSGLVQLFGIESPGLTSSLALADLVADRLGLPAIAL
ncbi:FAD-dependent oxidoreductase [Xaviernesmea oryzae]|uniref:FAD-dependent oxidoreductase n=1 Tax=Xaviernesmea oryzae TaxID=464029 RepID=A0A1Q9AXB4_9HYPH|nr:NAD(P)/FAD-dependent oxidoreductase [Xaviernesmea oryzae]OLP60083.1 FAD-dependent oxidoreductase [Xaviernesmea oryzae]SEK37284.1 L-2-hydroxyglutarate oxidase LhgO [Xaviernesmea oryzae]